MKTLYMTLVLTLFLTAPSPAMEVSGVRVDQSVMVHGQQLKLNGYGIRKKFFFKIYIGSLYASRHLSNYTDAVQDTGNKLIRMNFLYAKVDKGKITEAFKEGFVNNSPDMAASVEAQKFLALFTTDFSRCDVVDLIIGADGSVSASHNGTALGSIQSPKLARAVLAIYLGEKPADESLKKGMLGN
ncbi:MAG: chalcone isomerase family protein [Desulfuromonadaceae bacterium]|nr:chalcone isomerase family protein [Desulfuromonadaceae bacterium]